MKTSSISKVREFYENTADSYAQMMDSEIDLPIYSDILSRLAARIAALHGPILDTSCGSGHMLSRYHEKYDPIRSLIGLDLSPNMIALSSARLDSGAEFFVGDMRDLGSLESMSQAAVLNFFALHHLDPNEIHPALLEWGRVLCPGGQLLIATWEGSGPIDYGEESDVKALRYTEEEILEWTRVAGFVIDRCDVKPVEGMPMQAIYLEGTRE